jgi:hypothetical protein
MGTTQTGNEMLKMNETCDRCGPAVRVPGRHGAIVYAPNSNGQPIAEWSY